MLRWFSTWAMARLRDSWPPTLTASTQKGNPPCPSHLLGNRIIRDSPDDSRTAVNTRGFPGSLQGRSAIRTATVTSGSPDGGRGADLAFFAGIWTHSPIGYAGAGGGCGRSSAHSCTLTGSL